MTPAELRDYCLAKPGAWPDEPWEGDRSRRSAPRSSRSSVGVRRAEVRRHPRGGRRVAGPYPDDASVMPYIGRSGWNTLGSAARSPTTRSARRSTGPTTRVVAKLPKKERPA